MMMEESSDDSAELVDKEEAVTAEKQFIFHEIESSISNSSAAPLPPFITQSSTSLQNFQVVTKVPLNQEDLTRSLDTSLEVTAGPILPSKTRQEGALVSHVMPQPISMMSVLPPGPQVTPYEASSSITVTNVDMDFSPLPGTHGGIFNWITNNKMLSKVVEKTKSSMESMITILDPGMKEVIKSGGDICVLVTSNKKTKVGAIREAFQTVFGRATVIGQESHATTAAQPVGFAAGLKSAQERIQNLRQFENIPKEQPVVSVEGFVVEMLPDRWYEMSCFVLQDPQNRIDLQTFSQPSPIPAEYMLKAQDRTPKDYPLRWSGLAVTIGQIVEEELPHIGHIDWQNEITGVSRHESLHLAAKSLAYMYKKRLPSIFI